MRGLARLGDAWQGEVRQGLFTADCPLATVGFPVATPWGVAGWGAAGNGEARQGLFTAGCVWQRVHFGGNTMGRGLAGRGRVRHGGARKGKARAGNSGLAIFTSRFSSVATLFYQHF